MSNLYQQKVSLEQEYINALRDLYFLNTHTALNGYAARVNRRLIRERQEYIDYVTHQICLLEDKD